MTALRQRVAARRLLSRLGGDDNIRMRLEVFFSAYSREMVEAAERVGARTWPDIQSAHEDTHYFEIILALGFTGAQTDHPEEFIGWLKQQNRR